MTQGAQLPKCCAGESTKRAANLQLLGEKQRVVYVFQSQGRSEHDVLTRVAVDHPAAIAYHLRTGRLAERNRLGDESKIEAGSLRDRHGLGGRRNLHRAQHIDEQILPALERGQWVLCDRFTDSSEAYQGGGRELGSEIVLQLHKNLCRDLQPDLTILMLSDVARTVARARRRNVEQSRLMAEDENRFEKENRAFYERVLAGYMAIAARSKQRVVTVEAADAIAKVQKKIALIVEERLFPEAKFSQEKISERR